MLAESQLYINTNSSCISFVCSSRFIFLILFEDILILFEDILRHECEKKAENKRAKGKTAKGKIKIKL